MALGQQESSNISDYRVLAVPVSKAQSILKYKHYLKRLPVITYAYGLFDKDSLIGISTFGYGANRNMNCKTIFNNDMDVEVVELNRLFVDESCPKNTTSFFLSHSIRLLPKPICIFSYADSNQGHVGYIYQATNWIYTGISGKSNVYIDIRTGKKYHSKTIWSKYGTNCISKLPDHYVKDVHCGKHRYFFFSGSKAQIKKMKDGFTYSVLPYPKEDSKRYEIEKTPLEMFMTC